MKKLLLISTLFMCSCTKESTCIRCESYNDVFTGCKGQDLHEETDMREVLEHFQDNGYSCQYYTD